MKNPIFVALDVDSDKDALRIAEETAAYVGGFKVGPRLIVRYGASFIVAVGAKGSALYRQYFDIPSTMEGAIRASFEMGASFATIHAQAGKEALSGISQKSKKSSIKSDHLKSYSGDCAHQFPIRNSSISFENDANFGNGDGARKIDNRLLAYPASFVRPRKLHFFAKSFLRPTC